MKATKPQFRCCFISRILPSKTYVGCWTSWDSAWGQMWLYNEGGHTAWVEGTNTFHKG